MFQPHEKLRAWSCQMMMIELAHACSSIGVVRRPFLLHTGKMNFAVREWTHKSTFVARHLSRQVARCIAPRDTRTGVPFSCDPYRCCLLSVSSSPLLVAAVDLLLLPLSLRDDADGARTCDGKRICTAACWWLILFRKVGT